MPRAAHPRLPRFVGLPACVILICATSLSCVQADSPATLPATIDISAAIRQLGDDSYFVREAASKALRQAGEKARPALEQAALSKDGEVASRATEILDDLRAGINADTPPAVAALLRAYRDGNQQSRGNVIAELWNQNDAGRAALWFLADRETDPTLKEQILRTVMEDCGHRAAGLINAGDQSAAQALLLHGIMLGNQEAMRHYAAFAVASGTIDQAITAMTNAPDHRDFRNAALAWLYRAKGDLPLARRSAEQAGASCADLLNELLADDLQWKLLADRLNASGDHSDSSVKIRLLGVYAAGEDTASFGAILSEMRDDLKSGKLQRDQAVFIGHQCVQMGHIDKGIDLLTDSGFFREALEMRLYQARYQDAMALIEKARAAGSADRPGMEIEMARCLYGLGETDRASQMLATVTADPVFNALTPAYGDLIRVKLQLGMTDAAFHDCVRAVTLAKPGEDIDFCLHALTNDADWTDARWYHFLRTKYPDETVEATLRRFRSMFDHTIAPAVLEPIVREACTQAADKHPQDPWDCQRWFGSAARLLRGIQDEAAAAALDSQFYAITTSEQRVYATMEQLHAAVKEKNWPRVTQLCSIILQLDPQHADVLYLSAVVPAQNGDADRGQMRHRADLLMLADEQQRDSLAQLLTEGGLSDEAEAQKQFMCRTDAPWGYYSMNAIGDLADAAMNRQQYRIALDRWRQFNCYFARFGGAMIYPESYVIIPRMMMRFAALDALLRGDFGQATARAKQLIVSFPNNIDWPLEFIPDLESRGHRQEADEIFDAAYSGLVQEATAFPHCASLCNDIAWLCAKTHRRLDDALTYAQAAVAISPGNGRVLDTLAETYFARGNSAKAIELEHQAVTLNPKDPALASQLVRFVAGNSQPSSAAAPASPGK